MKRDKEDFINIIMNEIGLEVDDTGTVIDQDTEEEIKVKNKVLKYNDPESNVRITRNEIEFDPLNNSSLMCDLMKYYAGKVEIEEDQYMKTFYTVSDEDNKEKGRVEAVMGEDKKFSSGIYYMDSLKYADIVLLMNNNIKENLSDFDQKPIPTKKGCRR